MKEFKNKNKSNMEDTDKRKYWNEGGKEGKEKIEENTRGMKENLKRRKIKQ